MTDAFSSAWGFSGGNDANHEHLPGLVPGDAGYEDRIVGPVPAWGGVDPDVATIRSFVQARATGKGAVATAIHGVVVLAALRR